MVSYTSQIAIKAIVYLALKWNQGEKISIQEIAKKINGNTHTTGKMLQILVRNGLINSSKGPSGGFFINEKQLELSIHTIVETIDGNQAFKECGLGLNNCSEHHPCPIHNEYKIGRDIIESLFMNTKVKDLCDPLTNGLTHLI